MRKWTKYDNDFILEHGHKMTALQLAKCFSVSDGAIRGRLSYLGISPKPVQRGRRFGSTVHSKQAIDRALKMRESGVSVPQIAKATGISQTRVYAITRHVAPTIVKLPALQKKKLGKKSAQNLKPGPVSTASRTQIADTVRSRMMPWSTAA